MLPIRYLVPAVLALASCFPGSAQTLRPPLAAPVRPIVDFRPDGPASGGRACQKGHLAGRAAQEAHTARRVASSSRAHEQLMNRYDMQWARIDIALERTTMVTASRGARDQGDK